MKLPRLSLRYIPRKDFQGNSVLVISNWSFVFLIVGALLGVAESKQRTGLQCTACCSLVTTDN